MDVNLELIQFHKLFEGELLIEFLTFLHKLISEKIIIVIINYYYHY